MTTSEETRSCRRGPRGLLPQGFVFFNCNLDSPFWITTGNGVPLDLRLASPAIIKKFLVEDYLERHCEKVVKHLETKGELETGKKLEWHLLHKLLKSSKLTGRAKGVAMQIITNNVPTND